MDAAGQAYITAADRLDAASEDFDAALAAGVPGIIAECRAEHEAASRALHRAAKAAGC